MPNNTFLDYTHQRWKLNAVYLVSIPLFIGWKLLKYYYKNFLAEKIWIYDSIYAFVALGIVAFLFFSIRCPKCKTCLGYYFASKFSYRKFLTDLSKIKECPVCNYNQKEHSK